MRRVTGWIIGGLVAMALWIPGAGAQDNRHMYQGMDRNRPALRQGGNYGGLSTNREAMYRDHRDMRTDHQNAWRGMYQDREDVRRDRWDHRHDYSRLWQDRRAGNHADFQRDRAALWRERAQLRTDYWTFWHDWRNRRHDHYNRW
jgi:hypothetical protein